MGIFAKICGLLYLSAMVPYIVAILRGKTKPAKASWIVWTALDVVTLVSMLLKHEANVQIGLAVAVAVTIALLALKYGEPGWTLLDKLCMGAAAVSIPFCVFGSPETATVICCLAMVIGAFPTFASAWQDPSKEDKLAWTLMWASCIFGFFAIPRWTIAAAVQPIAFLITETVMMFILFVRPRFKNAARS